MGNTPLPCGVAAYKGGGWIPSFSLLIEAGAKNGHVYCQEPGRFENCSCELTVLDAVHRGGWQQSESSQGFQEPNGRRVDGKVPFSQIWVLNPHRGAVEGRKGGEKYGAKEDDVGRSDLAGLPWCKVFPAPRVPCCA